jgi:hypothetical protein
LLEEDMDLIKFENLHAKVQYGAGLEYMASANVG